MLNMLNKNNYHPKISLLVDPNNGCNLNCLHCGLSCAHLVHYSKQSIMHKDKYREMLQVLGPYMSSVSLGCIREPLVHSQIKDLILYSDELDTTDSLTLTTNGTLLDKSIVDLLMTTMHSWSINISIESAKPGTYEMIRRGAGFDTFKKNLTYLIDSKDKKKRDFRIVFSTVIIKPNFNDFFDLLDFAESMNIDGITFMQLQPHSFNKHLVLSPDEQLAFSEILLEIEEKAKNTQVKIGMIDSQSQNNQDTCDILTAIMNHKGDIYPPGHRDPIGCVFSREGLTSILNHYQILYDQEDPSGTKHQCY